MDRDANLACSLGSDSAWPRATRRERAWLLITSGMGVALLATSFVLTPDPSGAGTATQLGLPACGMLVMAGRPCPTCSMTTAFALFAHGQAVDAFLAQPLGAVLFLVVVIVTTGSIVLGWTGRSPSPVLARINWAVILIGLVIAGLLSWAYKIHQVAQQ